MISDYNEPTSKKVGFNVTTVMAGPITYLLTDYRNVCAITQEEFKNSCRHRYKRCIFFGICYTYIFVTGQNNKYDSVHGHSKLVISVS